MMEGRRGARWARKWSQGSSDEGLLGLVSPLSGRVPRPKSVDSPIRGKFHERLT